MHLWTPGDGLTQRAFLIAGLFSSIFVQLHPESFKKKNKIKSTVGKPIRESKCNHFSESNEAGGKPTTGAESIGCCVELSWWLPDSESGAKSDLVKFTSVMGQPMDQRSEKEWGKLRERKSTESSEAQRELLQFGGVLNLSAPQFLHQANVIMAPCGPVHLPVPFCLAKGRVSIFLDKLLSILTSWGFGFFIYKRKAHSSSCLTEMLWELMSGGL